MRGFLNKYVSPPPRGRIRRMRKGAGLLMVAAISAPIVALTSYGIAKINQAAFGGYNSSRIMLQAQQFAEAEAAVVKATAYSDLIAQSKVEIQNSNGYKRELQLSGESDYSEGVKQRIVTINVYKDAENLPRYSLKVLKTNVEVEASGGGVPVGTIIAWASSTAPTEGGTWLLCNGGSFSSGTYPKLYAVLGKTTLPSLNGRFLEGTTGTPGSTKEAGLPNITGYFTTGSWTSRTYELSGAFYNTDGTSGVGGNKGDGRLRAYFDASRSSAVYGKSTTVQPASYLVRYYIKAS